jgi:hypothetical protein
MRHHITSSLTDKNQNVFPQYSSQHLQHFNSQTQSLHPAINSLSHLSLHNNHSPNPPNLQHNHIRNPLFWTLLIQLLPKMCIIYFSVHAPCTHSHLLGALNCGLNCPTDTRHTFYLDDNGFECQTCVFLGCEEVDPNVVPVQYYAPLSGVEVGKGQEQEEEEEGGEYGEEPYCKDGDGFDAEEEGKRNSEHKDISDPESLCSEWRNEMRNLYTSQRYDYEYSPTLQHCRTTRHHETTPEHCTAAQHDATLQMTPRSAAHRDLVRDQLKKLPVQTAHVQEVHGQAFPTGQFHVPEGRNMFRPCMTAAGYSPMIFPLEQGGQ